MKQRPASLSSPSTVRRCRCSRVAPGTSYAPTADPRALSCVLGGVSWRGRVMVRWDDHPQGSIAFPRGPHRWPIFRLAEQWARGECAQPREGMCGIDLARRGHTEDEPMFYEVRTYTLRPGTVAEFEERFAKRLPLREKHSKLGAFWHTEVGPLNQVIHVYPYDRPATARGRAHRTSPRHRTPTAPRRAGPRRGAGVRDHDSGAVYARLGQPELWHGECV